ncbi:hypothetical protein BOTBODRAFT_43809 [Botryobasidium botryosum FD-172 SS1]|uniref:Uncharacterized protein n=1 Tax=Botryobasidium botryosum (strain FD-172 SS1) TaxID=930990 RepID=A0A067MMF6_BOTB1|nr:hypothetical protein BOTBODRAFT_43809 [Botryobasidium botryosum FD-172 SS1]
MDVHATIRATAGLSLVEEQLAALERTGVAIIVRTRVRALRDRYDMEKISDIEADDLMTIVAACVYLCSEMRKWWFCSYGFPIRLEWFLQVHGTALRRRILTMLLDTFKYDPVAPSILRDETIDTILKLLGSSVRTWKVDLSQGEVDRSIIAILRDHNYLDLMSPLEPVLPARGLGGMLSPCSTDWIKWASGLHTPKIRLSPGSAPDSSKPQDGRMTPG